jgi:hypothetical protein
MTAAQLRISWSAIATWRKAGVTAKWGRTRAGRPVILLRPSPRKDISWRLGWDAAKFADEMGDKDFNPDRPPMNSFSHPAQQAREYTAGARAYRRWYQLDAHLLEAICRNLDANGGNLSDAVESSLLLTDIFSI